MMETMYDYRFEGELPVRVETCDYCQGAINKGDEYYKIENLSLCVECIREFKCEAGEE